MVVFFFSVMAIWVFIVIFGDIFHRRDLSGGAKAGSCLLIFVIPLIWALWASPPLLTGMLPTLGAFRDDRAADRPRLISSDRVGNN